MTDLVKVHFVITKEQHREMKRLADLTGQTMSFFSREGLDYILSQKNKGLTVATAKQAGSHQPNPVYSRQNNEKKGATSTELSRKTPRGFEPGCEGKIVCSGCKEEPVGGFLGYCGLKYCFGCVKRKLGIPLPVKQLFLEVRINRLKYKLDISQKLLKRFYITGKGGES